MATEVVSTPHHGTAGVQRDWKAVAAVIDHTLLAPDTIATQIEELCAEALQYRFACVCVAPVHLSLAASLLRGSGVHAGTPVGFPMGSVSTSLKRFEAEEAVKLGADEIDMVMNIGALKAGQLRAVERDIRAVVEMGHAGSALVKVVIEASLLSIQEKIVSCQIALAAGADFVKTSTGFAHGGATIEDVQLMRGVVGEHAGVKASGGIRTAEDCIAMLEAGANRIGTSASVSIVGELGAP